MGFGNACPFFIASWVIWKIRKEIFSEFSKQLSDLEQLWCRRPGRSSCEEHHAGASLSRTKLIVAGGPAGRGPALVFQPQPLLMAWPDPFRQPEPHEPQACLARRPGCASHDSDVSVHNIMSDPGLGLVVTRISLVLRARDGVAGQLVVVIQVACCRRTVLASLL